MYIEELKFSLWADFIEREYLDGEFRELIDKGIINGATSNPAIFKNAILNSKAYKEQLSTLSGDAKSKYEALAIYDIQKAADILKPLYERGNDGYVSIEVDPNLCDDAKGTIEEGLRLYKMIDRENVMIKVPATKAGYEAMEALTASSIPVNATLVFKKEQALACATAFAKGAKRATSVADTVISVFVSRIDRALDPLLKEKGLTPGVTGIYNSSLIYEAIEEMQVPKCRTLFASTGVKGDDYPPHYYIENLLAYHSVNTAPVDTIKAYVTNGKKAKALPIDPTKIKEHFDTIASIGIDLEAELDKQIADGLEAFKVAFKEIMESI
ncbi:Transaldolase [hydrothermal vent metagenome]|uniref:Transaldolase n=1 Tax=hydrothermal vent metagenome TaxID=652676 RepID=A0A1W1C149_9ZZZZ